MASEGVSRACDSPAERAGRAGLLLGALAILLLFAEACIPRFIMRGDTARRADGWTIVLEALKDGPNSVQTAGDTYTLARRGSRFLWAWVRIRNDLGSQRVFGYDTCDMDLGDTAVLPALVYAFLFDSEKRSEEYGPGETISRALIFSYPVGLLPTRIRCGNMIFAVPAPGQAGSS
jgi:hypothetical protein